jgi:ribonuclease HII
MRGKEELANYRLEKELLDSGFFFICGIDEAGRGALSGPVVASACILDPDNIPIGIMDSKKLSAGKREYLCREIMTTSLNWSIGLADNYQIDCLDILEATKRAMKRAVNNLSIKPDILLIDAVQLNDLKISQKSYIKGDVNVISISAASILAKVSRDKIMMYYHKLYPSYDWKSNKGYPTKQHKAAIEKYGPSRLHRRTFKSVIL